MPVAEAGDPIDDPSSPWPDDRRTVPLGTLCVEHLSGQPYAGEVYKPTGHRSEAAARQHLAL